MSHNQSSYTSTSYTSTSYTSSSSSSTTNSSSSSGEPQTYTKSTSTRSHYNDRDGGTSERVTHETGKPTLVETSQIPSSGGGRIESGDGGGRERGRIEDVTDRDEKEQSEADQRYLDAMEDEYAKREGGA